MMVFNPNEKINYVFSDSFNSPELFIFHNNVIKYMDNNKKHLCKKRKIEKLFVINNNK